MSIHEHASAPQPRLRLKALLVLTVLAGLLGMHGLANTGTLPATSSSSHAAHHLRPAMATAAPAPAPAPGSASREHGQHACCPGRDDGADGSGGGTGHAHHADPTCASGALPGAVVLPALPASLTGTADRAVPLAGRLADGTTGARAPPSLAQLQVLRI
ncbi:hypothetical protein HEK616_71340 [Streptomyces nigrescens]|uniref:Secreted protein n=1 Tax=Streptomyces nigrescens TaxID=1920 RepID=A0ABM8A4S2_STRNI|nr:DUF6153 family protein [Streptomyces nigrescens]BDM73647.1 hypothetical protein HEK616_71340 [Streptomyces nigrescens]